MLREGLEDILINTIYHELLHVVYNKYAIENKLVGWDENGKLFQADEFKEVQAHGGHWGKWLEWADYISKELNLTLPITANCAANEVERLIKANDDIEPAVEIYCTNWDNKMSFLSVSETTIEHEFPEPFILFEL